MYINHKLKIIDYVETKSTFFCPICKFPLGSNLDFEKNEKFNCCYECYQTFVQARVKEWEEGWRPDKTRVEEYIYLRKKIYSNIINLTEK